MSAGNTEPAPRRADCRAAGSRALRLRSKPKLAYAAVWTLAYASLNWTHPLHIQPAISAPDTKTYVAVAQSMRGQRWRLILDPHLGREGWGGGFALLLTYLSGAPNREQMEREASVRAPLAQQVLASVSYLCLFYAVLGAVPAPLAWLVAPIPLLLSLTTMIRCWHGVLLTESTVLSSGALYMAAFILFLAQAPRRSRLPALLVALLFTSIFFGTARDLNSLLVLLGTGLLICFCLLRRAWLPAAALTVLVLPIVPFLSYRAYTSGRWHISVSSALLRRVLPFEEDRRFWQQHYGMPYDDSWKVLHGKWGQEPTVRQHDAFQSYLRARVPSAYPRWLLATLPTRCAEVPYGIVLSGRVMWCCPRRYAQEARCRPVLPALDWAVADLPFRVFSQPPIYASGPIMFALWLSLALSLACLISPLRAAYGPFALLLAWLSLGVLCDTFMTWHGDPGEPMRHAYLSAVLFRLLVLWVAACSLAIGISGVLRLGGRVLGRRSREKASAHRNNSGAVAGDTGDQT